MQRKHAAIMLAMVMLAGCGGEEPGATIESDQQPQDAGGQPLPPPETPAPETVREAAKVGVGKQGRDYGTGPVATPIATYFRTKQRIAFLQIATPMNMYKAIHGHFPKTHEEFMEEIIKKNSIKLPELPAGERYVYDPEKAAKMSSYDPQDPPLMVERPR